MRRTMLKSKIHRATVTAADVDYEGSLTLDAHLLEAADILPYEALHVWNVTRGTRLQTYAIAGEPGTGVVCANGGAAHLLQPGDRIIVATFAELDDAAARSHRPRVVLVDDKNRAPLTGHRPDCPRGSAGIPNWFFLLAITTAAVILLEIVPHEPAVCPDG